RSPICFASFCWEKSSDSSSALRRCWIGSSGALCWAREEPGSHDAVKTTSAARKATAGGNCAFIVFATTDGFDRAARREWPDSEGGPAGSFRIIAPQPPQRLGQNSAAVLAVVAFGAELEFVVVTHELQRRRHLLVRQRPVPVQIVQVVRAVLQKHSDRLFLRLADQRRIVVSAADVGETADMAEDLAEFFWPFPCHGQ